MKTSSLATLIAGFVLLSGTLAAAQDSVPNQETLEKQLTEMLENATLKGNWLPVQEEGLGEVKTDAYQIVRATKKDGDQWEIVAKMSRQGQTMEVPIPVQVKWAGDTAVVILNGVQTGRDGSYSARVLFHNDVYAGSWWDQEGKAGVVSGVVTRE